MKVILSTITALLLCTLIVMSQDLTKQINQNFATYIPSEKLYIHTDKPGYFLQDTIWFAAYLTNVTNNENVKSNFINVDLIDKFDTVIISKKIKRDSLGGFNGYLELAEDIPEGEYTIRAYTSWMRNFHKEFFYYKTITLRQQFTISKRMTIQAKNVDSLLILKLNLGGEELANRNVSCNIKNLTTNKAYKVGNETSNSEGIVTLPTRGLSAGDIVVIDVKGKIDKMNFENSLRVEIPRADYDLQFLPEGGDFVAGDVRRLAFKALSSSGNPIDVTGYILNSQGDTVSHINTKKDGMGMVTIFADQSQKYTAYAMSKDSITKVIKLPDVKTDGVALMVNSDTTKINYMIQKRGVLASQKMYVLLHSHDKLHYIMPLADTIVRHSIPLGELTPGVSHLVVVDQQGAPLAERLFFVQPQTTEMVVKTDKENYGIRAPIRLELSLPDGLKGNFSVSVTDDNMVPRSPFADNIVSNLLLTSDLHGTIEDPYSYIGSADVDLVMLTNGWRRFNISDIINNKQQKNNYFLEAGQAITGKVVSPYKKNLLESNVFAQIVTSDSSIMAEIDENGRFEIPYLDIAGTKRVMLQAFNLKNRPLEARIKIDTIPTAASPWVKRQLNMDSFERLISNIAANDNQPSTEVMNYNDIYKQLNIDEVVVRGRQKVKNVYKPEKEIQENRLSRKLSYYASPFNRYMNYINPNWDVVDLIVRQGWVLDMDNHASNTRRNYYGGLLFVIDGVKHKIDNSLLELKTVCHFRGYDITAIEFITPPRSYSYGANAGVIVIETRYSNPQAYLNRVRDDLAILDFIGYDKCDSEFYSPQYTKAANETNTIDNRSTVYWKPSVALEGGNVQKLNFYSTDNSKRTYSVIIEGVKEDGTPIFKTHKINLEP